MLVGADVLKVVLLCGVAAQFGCKSKSEVPAGSTRPAEKALRLAAESAEPGSAADSSTASWQSLCAAAERMEFPAGAAPNSHEMKPGDARRYYYGIGVPVDYVRARKAALLERAAGQDGFVAGTVLMMIYANGHGVERDLDLAIKLACEGAEDQARAEIQGRVSHLQSMKTPPVGPPFDFCDDVSGGEMEGYCAQLAEQRRDAQRQQALAALSQGWSAEQRASFERVQTALTRFAELHAQKERDLSAVDRGMVVAEAQGELKEALLEDIQRFELGKLPEHTAEDYRKADEELNRVYKATLAKDFSDTTITAAGIKATEKAWLAYRDAWQALAAQRYAQVDQVAFKVWLTRQRTEQLRQL